MLKLNTTTIDTSYKVKVSLRHQTFDCLEKIEKIYPNVTKTGVCDSLHQNLITRIRTNIEEMQEELKRKIKESPGVKEGASSSMEVGGIDLRKIRYRVVFSEG